MKNRDCGDDKITCLTSIDNWAWMHITHMKVRSSNAVICISNALTGEGRQR